MHLASAFDSRQRFLEQLRKRFGSRTFNISANIKAANVLAHYYSTLKEDAHSNPDCTGKVFFHADHLGYQKGTYWILSPDVSLFIFYAIDCLATAVLKVLCYGINVL